MEYHRYGDFKLHDYTGSWIGIAFLFLFAAVCVVMDLHILYAIVPLSYASFWLFSICRKLCEKFTLSGNTLTINGKNDQTTILPSEVTVVIAYADVRPFLAFRTAIGNETHILKGQYSVSLLNRTDTDVVLEAIHRNYIQKYTNSSIEIAVEPWLIYNFVCKDTLLCEIIRDIRCNIIVPESLAASVPINLKNPNVYVDRGH